MPVAVPDLRDTLNRLHIVRNAADAQLATKQAPVEAARGLADGLLHVLVVSAAVGSLDGDHVMPIPVEADEAGNQEFAAQLVAFGGGEGVVDEQSVADGFVDDAV